MKNKQNPGDGTFNTKNTKMVTDADIAMLNKYGITVTKTK